MSCLLGAGTALWGKGTKSMKKLLRTAAAAACLCLLAACAPARQAGGGEPGAPREDFTSVPSGMQAGGEPEAMAAPVAFMGAKLLMDRVYEGDSTRLLAGSFGLTPVVPPKRNCADPWDHDRQAYKGRNVVERVFNRMKHCRKAATRYDRLDATFLANLQLALIAIQLKNTSKTTSVNTP